MKKVLVTLLLLTALVSAVFAADLEISNLKVEENETIYVVLIRSTDEVSFRIYMGGTSKVDSSHFCDMVYVVKDGSQFEDCTLELSYISLSGREYSGLQGETITGEYLLSQLVAETDQFHNIEPGFHIDEEGDFYYGYYVTLGILAESHYDDSLPLEAE